MIRKNRAKKLKKITKKRDLQGNKKKRKKQGIIQVLNKVITRILT